MEEIEDSSILHIPDGLARRGVSSKNTPNKAKQVSNSAWINECVILVQKSFLGTPHIYFKNGLLSKSFVTISNSTVASKPPLEVHFEEAVLLSKPSLKIYLFLRTVCLREAFLKIGDF